MNKSSIAPATSASSLQETEKNLRLHETPEDAMAKELQEWSAEIAQKILGVWRKEGYKNKINVSEISQALLDRRQFCVNYEATDQKAREIAEERIQEYGPEHIKK